MLVHLAPALAGFQEADRIYSMTWSYKLKSCCMMLLLCQVQEICHLVGWRAGRLKSTAISAVMRQLDRDHGQRTVVGVDGGVFEHYGKYREAMQEGLSEVMGKKAARSVVFKHVNDGSSLGAAYLAAAAVRADSPRDSEGSQNEW